MTRKTLTLPMVAECVSCLEVAPCESTAAGPACHECVSFAVAAVVEALS